MVAAVCLAGRPLAQEAAAPQAPAPTFRGGIDSVSVDVIVTDKQGRPVTDLTPADFEVREAGKVQSIENFKLVRIDDGREDPSAARDILSPAEHDREVASESNRLLVIYLDDYHTRVGNSLAIREKLAAFVSQLAPHDLVAITMPMMPASALTFSRDHEGLANQIMGFLGRKYNYVPKTAIESRYAGEPPAVQERLRNTWTMASLRALCEWMGSFRPGRKTVLYVSEGMSNTIPQGALTTGSDFTSIPTPAADPNARMSNQELMLSMELVADLQQRVFTVAARNNVAIYTLDPRGLSPTEFSVADVVSATADRQILGQTTEVLRTIADQTDGRAIVNGNNPLPSLQQMVRDGSTYYLLGYTSSSQFRDGRFHEIQVKVKRRDVDVRARKGYWAVSADELMKAEAPKAVVASEVTDALGALASVAESGRRQPVTVWLGATRGAAEKAKVTMVWESSAELPADAPDRVDHLQVTAHSIYGDRLFDGRLDRDPALQTTGGVVTFEAPAGSVRVKVEVRNAAERRLETTDDVLDVPDFSSTAAQITTPFVFRGRTARDLQAVRAVASPMPTTARAFARAERLLLRFEAYGPGGGTPTITMKILNQNGSSVAAMPAPARTGPNSFESEFSLGAFPPSDYVIEIAADVNGEVVKRLLGIRVVG